jgi:hypothetical protein
MRWIKWRHKVELGGVTLVVATALALVGCVNVARQEAEISPGMNRRAITAIMGTPMDRSIKGAREAWQYGHIVGFGQCVYTTIWFLDSKVVGMTSRRGPSVAGCGLGSGPIDWRQMPH